MPAWTDEEVGYLRENAQKMSRRELAEALGKSEDAVKKKARRMGIESLETKDAHRRSATGKRRRGMGMDPQDPESSVAKRVMTLKGQAVEGEEDLPRITDGDLARWDSDHVACFEELFGTEILVGRDEEKTPWQRMIIESIMENDYVIVASGRQLGKSRLMAECALKVALFAPNSVCLIVAPTQDQVTVDSDYVRDVLYRRPELEASIQYFTTEKLVLWNGSVLHFRTTGNPQNVRSLARAHIFADEGCFHKQAVWRALMPTRAVGAGKLIVSTTAWGKSSRNQVYRWWDREDSKWTKLKFMTKINPLVTDEFLAGELEDLGPVAFRAEYEAEWIDETDAWFPSSLIQECHASYGMHTRALPGWVYFVGEDPGHVRDRTGAVVLGQEKGSDVLYVVRVEVSQGGREAVNIFNALVNAFRPRAAVADARSHADCARMEEAYPRLARYKSGVNQRMELYQRLKAYMELGNLKIPYPDESRAARILNAELESISYELTRSGNVVYDHPRNGTDDVTDALGYAVQASRRKPFRATTLRF